jgi:lipopolysaccharide export system permease protein
MHFFRAFGLVFFSIAGIILVFSLVRSLSAGGARVPFGIALQFGTYEIIRTLNTTLPLCVLLSGSLAFWRLARTSELTIIRGAGVSAWQFLSPILAACTMIGIINATVFSHLSSVMMARIDNLSYRYKLTQKNPMSFSQSGLWLKENNPSTQSFLYARGLAKRGDALLTKDITIFITDFESNFIRRIDAKSAILEAGKLKLVDTTMTEPSLREEKFPEYDYPTTLSAEKIEENSSEPESFSFWQLPGFIKFFEESGFSAKKHRLYFYTLLLMPLSLAAMLMVSTLFTLAPHRGQSNMLLKLATGIGIGFGAFFMDQVARAMGVSGRLPLFASSIIAPVTTILLCIWILLYSEEG